MVGVGRVVEMGPVVPVLVGICGRRGGRCRREIEVTLDEIYSTHTTKKAGYVVERDRPRYI